MPPVRPLIGSLQRRIAERELVVAVGMVLMLARVAAGLRELPVDAGAARAGDDRQDAIEDLPSREVLIEAVVAPDRAARGRSARCRSPARAGCRIAADVAVMAQERHDIADRREADAHHDRIARAVDELEDRAAIEAGRGRPRDLDMGSSISRHASPGGVDARIGLALAHRQRSTRRIGDRIDQRADEPILRDLLDVAVAEQSGRFGDELLAHHAGDAFDDGEARDQAIVAGGTSPCQALHTSV